MLTCLPVLIVALGSAAPGFDQTPITVKELAEYRLTLGVFRQFERASRLIAEAMRQDVSLSDTPLFTRDVAVLDDAAEAAARLERRLSNEPALAAALFAANLSAREYAKFALALVAARLAHGFVESGAMRRVPPGVPADNLAFVSAHRREVSAVLRAVGISDAQ